MKWILVFLLLFIMSCMIPPHNYYMINFETRKFPEIRTQMPCWMGETARLIWEDVQTWDEYVIKKARK